MRYARADGTWRIVAVYPKEVPVSLDPMDPLSGKRMIERFFQRFEDRNPGESGKGLNFSDELSFGIRGWLWNAYFAEEFRKRMGYDVVPELASPFEETGPRTVKIGLDYSNVMVALEEENHFRPFYDWHYSRGMLYGCDHGGRRASPGNDQPNLASDVIRNKAPSPVMYNNSRRRFLVLHHEETSYGLVQTAWRVF